ncbi:MAG TPA: diacylglycerol kinase family protein [Rhodothermales bacterium]|nr:diacylglycerol kinase family protein [Rhodothermales bacterium]
MRVTLMHNPRAGDEQVKPDELMEALRNAEYDPAYQSIKKKGYEKALRDPGALVVIAGGDGTVEKVARSLIGRGIPIGVLPLGTANNVATTLGIEGPYEQIISSWSLDRRQSFDVGALQSPWGDGYFIEAAGLGLFPHTMSVADADGEDSGASTTAEELRISYDRIKRLLPDYASQTYTITVDGYDLSGEYLLVEAMNTSWIGPNLHLARTADPGDGLLDLVLSRADKRDELLRYLSVSGPGEPADLPVTIRRGRHIQIRWSGSKLHVDDEIWPEEDQDADEAPSAKRSELLDVRIRPGALEFLVPPD